MQGMIYSGEGIQNGERITPKLKRIVDLTIDKKRRLQFELREDNEVTIVGPLYALQDFSRMKWAERDGELGYKLGYVKDDGTINRNVSNYKYYANFCNYDKGLQRTIRFQLGLNKEDRLLFYRPHFKLMNEDETIVYIKDRLHYKNLTKFIKYTIKEQEIYHEIIGLEYNLRYNWILLQKCGALKEIMKNSLFFNNTQEV